jgi:tellurite resistance protein TehA-like permease
MLSVKEMNHSLLLLLVKLIGNTLGTHLISFINCIVIICTTYIYLRSIAHMHQRAAEVQEKYVKDEGWILD